MYYHFSAFKITNIDARLDSIAQSAISLLMLFTSKYWVLNKIHYQ